MSLDTTLEKKLCSYVERHQNRLVEIIRDLVRIPSENTPPTGEEESCQHYVAEFLHHQGWDPSLYYLTDVQGLQEHPMFWPGRNYTRRPNVGARREG